MYKSALGVQVNPINELTIYVYGDWMPVASKTDTAQTTEAFFAGYQIGDMGKIGLEYDMQERGIKVKDKSGNLVDKNVGGLSVYGMYNIIKVLEVFARYDMASSNSDWNTSVDGSTVIGGLQYSPVSKIKLAADYQHSLLKASGAIASDRVYLNCEFDY